MTFRQAQPHPRPGRQVPCGVRRRARRRGHQGRAQRHPDTPHELDHGTLGPDLPPRIAGPDSDLEPATSAARPTRIRMLLQPPPASPGHRQRPTPVPIAHPDRRPRRDSPAPRPTTRSAWRHPARIRTCRLTCADKVSGRHRVEGNWECLRSVVQPGLLLGTSRVRTSFDRTRDVERVVLSSACRDNVILRRRARPSTTDQA
jgi:hypothetical protein